MAKITDAYRKAALSRSFLVNSNKVHQTAPATLYAASIEFANLGFIVKPEELTGISAADLAANLEAARSLLGADRAMTPIYPGFPKQVEELETMTLLVEQILHYWTAGAFLPNHPTVAREGLPLQDMLRHGRELKVLSAAAAARSFIEELTNDATALSPDEKTILEGAIELKHPTLAEVTKLSHQARHGENLQTFLSLTAKHSTLSAEEILKAALPGIRNLDHTLRVILSLFTSPYSSEREASYGLAVSTLADGEAGSVRMTRISRPVRRLIVERLGVLSEGFKADRLLTRQRLWRGVLRAVHPYDFKLTEAQKRAADIIHSNVEHKTFNSLVEEAMSAGKVKKAVKLLAEHQPGQLLRRLVALLRLVSTDKQAEVLAAAVESSASGAAVSTLISSYNGILSANDTTSRVTRVAGRSNTLVERKEITQVKKAHLKLVAKAVKSALLAALKSTPAPSAPVAVESTTPMPLMKRDAASSDRVLDRGQELTLAQGGDILRIFGHWRNNKSESSYMDIGVVILDQDFKALTNSTWNTWGAARGWSTYSGDKLVYPGDSAPEFIDIKLAELSKLHPTARWAAMTVQAWAGWTIESVDFIAGAMLRSKPQAGEVFDPRSVVTAFKPTVLSSQAVPFAVNLETGALVWLDTSSGAKEANVSASVDDSIGTLVYDELARPRLTQGEFAKLWAKAHGVKTVKEPVDREALLKLL